MIYHMSDQLNEYETRLQRLEQLKTAGVIPYANKYDKQQSLLELTAIGEDTKSLSDGDTLLKEWAKQSYSTAWRMMSFRTMGKLSFATLRDSTWDLQIAFVKNLSSLHTGQVVTDAIEIDGQETNAYKFAEKFLDIGDFVWVKGELFVTKHGELTLFVDEYQLLSKALRPLGDKWHGIQDEEKKYRQRYLDMTMNEDSFIVMKLRSQFIRTLREFYRTHDFVELDTPILGNSASGAAATPFSTRHEDFDMDMYLRIAPEIALKIATVGRLEKVFEIGKDFRNEGSSPSHHQEFLVAEHYAVYRNFEDNIKFTESMFDYLFDHLPELNRKVSIADKEWVEREVDFSTPWQRIDYTDQIKKDSGIDVSVYGPEDENKLREIIKDKGHKREWLDNQTTATMIDYLYKKVTRPQIIWPTFIYNYPKTMQPLARQSDSNENIVEQFQVIVNGREILKAYSELVDPVIQQANFDEQSGAVAKGDSEATKSDDEFVLSMEHGMPPQSWRGMGIDRILSLLLGKSNIRDVIMFPMMKPEQGSWNNAIEDIKINWNSEWEDQTTLITPSIDQADSLVQKYLTDTKRHCTQVASVMKWFANQLWEDEEQWYIVWLLHDLDRDHIAKDADKHLGDEFEAMMDEIWADESLKSAIRSHYPDGTGITPSSLLEKYLISVDELSWFIFAYSLMRPTGMEGMKASSIKKKVKDKAFAKWVDREHLKNCEKYLGIELGEFIPQIIKAMNSL